MIAYVVSKPPGPPVWQVVLTVALLISAGLLAFGGLVVFAEWLQRRAPRVAFALGALLVVGIIAAVIGGVYVAGHPPACASSGTC